MLPLCFDKLRPFFNGIVLANDRVIWWIGVCVDRYVDSENHAFRRIFPKSNNLAVPGIQIIKVVKVWISPLLGF